MTPAPPILFDGPGFELIVHTSGGRTFLASRRTHAHLWETQRRLTSRRPGAFLRVIQGAYNVGVDASAGTHDKDAVVDAEIVGWDDWLAEQRFLRECGWADWVRSPPTFTWHHHAVSLGYTTEVGIYVPAQVDDYYRHAIGLKGQHNSGSDNTWHPANIDSTVFRFPEWSDYQEAHMPLNADDKDFIREVVHNAAEKAAAKAVKDLLDTDVSPATGDGGEVVTALIALRRAGATPELVRRARDSVLAKLPKLP